MPSKPSLLPWILSSGLVVTLGCDSSSITGPVGPDEERRTPNLAVTLSSYFPPSEASGGWRKTTSDTEIRSLGMNPTALAAFGAYNMSLPWSKYGTGVSGYDASDKASLVIKNGWIVGEYYNQASASTDVYYLASNGKTFGIMLFGRMLLDYPNLEITRASKLYDQRWLPQGFPLTDPRKANITFEHVFAHVSGILPEVEAPIGAGAVQGGTNWNFAPFTVGHDADYPQSGPLYFEPGDSSTYTKGRPYSSVAFNHLSLVFRNVTGVEPSLYLRSGILDRIGVGRMAYKRPSGMGEYHWAVGGNGLASARDYARLMYLLLHEGDWNGTRIFEASWLRNFITTTKYYNLRSNVDCFWGTQYPKDLYRTTGSGLNWAFIVPSLDLIATLNGRTPNSMSAEVIANFLQNLFASVTQEYETCDGRIIDGPPSPTGIVLTVTTREDATKRYMTLEWTGASGPTVDLYRNGAFTKSTDNDGHYVNSLNVTATMTYVYRVCEAGTSTCSNDAIAEFGGGSSPPNAPPTASFTSACANLVCTFTDASTDGDGVVTAWSWQFGDGSASTDRNPGHAYASAGVYEVSLVATDNAGATGAITQTITVSPPLPNAPPTASFSWSCTGLTCNFADQSTDTDGSVVAWEWDFGDGGTAAGSNPGHTYASEGNPTVTLKITDDQGATDTHALEITVTPPPPNAPPVAGFSSQCIGLTCTFTDLSTDSDGSVTAWHWDFGDGTTSTQRSPTRTYAAAGAYDVMLIVTDNNGATDEQPGQVVITAPVIALTVSGRTDGTKRYMTLDWTGAGGATVDVYRNGAFTKSTDNDGHYVNSLNVTATMTYVYRVCQAGSSICSNEATVTFN